MLELVNIRGGIMRFATIFILVTLFIPIVGVLLYTALNPRDAALWGRRWQFKNENLEPSDEVIKYNRVMSIIMLIIIIFILVITIIRL